MTRIKPRKAPRPAAKPRPASRWKRALRWLALLLVLGSALLAWTVRDAQQQMDRPLALAEPVTVEIAAGSSLRGAMGVLAERGWLSSRRLVVYAELYARLLGREADLKAGEYELVPGMSMIDVLGLFWSGRTLLHELRIIEGSRFQTVLDQIAAHPQLKHTLDPLTPRTAMAALGHPARHPEGRLFPDTYRFPRGTRDVTVLRQAFSAMEQVLAAEWAVRATDLPLASADEALILASIVEKETGLAAERPTIAGVFIRRLQLGMRLQTDPTIIYGLGERFDGNLRRSDLGTDTPYNTYTRSGLPPTPICLPGRAAIQAALRPAEGDALFFVAKGDGSHQFSATLAEHEAAVRRYQLRRGS